MSMSSAGLTITYTAPEAAGTTTPALRLEQQPVDGVGKLGLQDLAAMISLAVSGVSARTYRPGSCTAWLEDGLLKVLLGLYVWPSPLDLEYELHGDLVVPGEYRAVEMEREFDVVVGMTTSVNLPFLTRSATMEWQTPCYNDLGEVVGRPKMEIVADQLLLDAEVFGVLRFRCLALGYLHELLFSVPKTTTERVTDIKPAVTARWMAGEEQQHERLELQLPACANTLLLACEDGTPINPEPIMAAAMRHVIEYNSCTGRVYRVYREPTGGKIVVGHTGLSTAPLINQPFGW